MNKVKLSKRLLAATSLIEKGAFVADIGTDHAYIPIYLVQEGIARGVVASDINHGPIARAKENVEKYGYSDKIDLVISDGLESLKEYSPNYILICGMGGDLIQRIIEKSDYVRNKDVYLILQPMTHVPQLRKYLSSGFEIIDEKIVYEDEKLYQIICARFDGKEHTYSQIELEIGKINILHKEEEFLRLVDFTLKKKQKKLEGLRIGNCDTKEVEKEIDELLRLKNEV